MCGRILSEECASLFQKPANLVRIADTAILLISKIHTCHDKYIYIYTYSHDLQHLYMVYDTIAPLLPHIT